MITYNMRYRGAFEYDKCVLNALQFHNEVNVISKKEFNLTPDEISLKSIQEETNREFNKVITKSKDLYLLLQTYREV